ncbi:hypothetical protein [Rhodococcus phenolicus]|uniref:hypothetical protein n=1 Tax=Rhodococcus phenolicus TaxID=263849 RepID=UPI000A7B5B6C|nr:hypothetical protein [Rhodococcus phenolicus]
MTARQLDTANRKDSGDTGSIAESDPFDSRYRLDVVALNTADVVRFAGGWLFDRVMAGWNVTVFVQDASDLRPLRILGVGTGDLESVLESRRNGMYPHTVAVESDLYSSDIRVRDGVHAALGHHPTEVTLWGDRIPPELDSDVRLVQHRLSLAARAFKAQALVAAGATEPDVAAAETFCTGRLSRPRVRSDLLPAG